jgi:hypothetical protein
MNNKWRDEVLNQLVICGIYGKKHDQNPALAINDLINWHIGVYVFDIKENTLKRKVKNFWNRIIHRSCDF